MKKYLGLVVMLAASGAATAQSSVTLFGIVDAGLTYAKASGGDSVYGMSNSGNLTSRLGLRGTEDLGGGLKAGFWLEGGFNNDSGAGLTAGSFDFKRRSTISLTGDFGEVRMGRAFTRAYENLSRHDVFGQVGIGQNQTWYNAPAAVVRSSNMLTYLSPSLSGFRVSADLGFGEAAGSASNNRYLGASATYDNGPLSLSLAAEQWNDAAYTAGTQTIVLDNTSAYGLGAGYNFGAIRLAGLVRQQRNKPITGESVKFNTAHVGAVVPLGAGEARVGYKLLRQRQHAGQGPSTVAGLCLQPFQAHGALWHLRFHEEPAAGTLHADGRGPQHHSSRARQKPECDHHGNSPQFLRHRLAIVALQAMKPAEGQAWANRAGQAAAAVLSSRSPPATHAQCVPRRA